MQISDFSSMAEYYAELAKLQSRKSGKSSAAEFFEQGDSDSSGSVSASEFAALFSQAQSAGSPEAASTSTASIEPVAGVEGKQPPPPPMSTEELEEMFAGADQDGDGALSFEEFSTLSEKMRQRPPEGAQQGAGGAQDLLSMLQGSSGYGSVFGLNNDSSSTTNMLTELLKSFGSESASSSSGYSMYIQNLVKSAYGA